MQQHPGYFAGIIRACGRSKDLDSAKQVHLEIQLSGLRNNKFLSNLLVEMYGRCGALKDAKLVFDSIHDPNLFSWNILLAAYARYGYTQEALNLFRNIPKPDVYTYTAMITALAKSGNVSEAREIFDRMPVRNNIAWNALFCAYAHNGFIQESKEIFDSLTEKSVVSWTIMFAAYARAGRVEDAKVLFDRMPEKDPVAWNLMISAYTKAGRLEDARALFDSMPSPDLVSWTEMITSYAENSQLNQAQELFEAMPVKDTVSWTAMISGFVQNGEAGQALRLFNLMDLEGLFISKLSFVAALDACAHIPSLAAGRILHSDARDRGFETDLMVSTAVVNMYGKCARVSEAREAFERVPVWQRDVVLWNAMITAYARTADHSESLRLFEEMALQGIPPNSVTLLGVLTASSGGLRECWTNFVSMQMDFGVVPSNDCYACMGDLLGRAGAVEETEQLLRSMPYRWDSNPSFWLALLNACKIHSDERCGRRVAEQVLGIEPSNPCSYVLLSNLFKSAESM